MLNSLASDLFHVYLIRFFGASSSSSCPDSLSQELSFIYSNLSFLSRSTDPSIIDHALSLLNINVCESCFTPISSRTHCCSICNTALYCCSEHLNKHRTLHSFICHSLANLSSCSSSDVLSCLPSPSSPIPSDLHEWVQSVERRAVAIDPSLSPSCDVYPLEEEEPEELVINSPLGKLTSIGKKLTEAASDCRKQNTKDLEYLEGIVLKKDDEIQELMVNNKFLQSRIDELQFLESLNEPEFLEDLKSQRKELQSIKRKMIQIEDSNMELKNEIQKLNEECKVEMKKNRLLRFQLENAESLHKKEIQSKNDQITKLEAECAKLNQNLEYCYMAFNDIDLGRERVTYNSVKVQTENFKYFDGFSQTPTICTSFKFTQTSLLTQSISVNTIQKTSVDCGCDPLIKIRDQFTQTLAQKSKSKSKSNKLDLIREFFSPSFILSNYDSSFLTVQQLIPPNKYKGSADDYLFVFDKSIELVVEYRRKKSLDAWRIMILRCKYLKKASVIAEKLSKTESKNSLLDSLSQLTTDWQRELSNWKSKRKEQTKILYDSAKVALSVLIDCDLPRHKGQKVVDFSGFSNDSIDFSSLANNIDSLSEIISIDFSKLNSAQKKINLIGIVKAMLSGKDIGHVAQGQKDDVYRALSPPKSRPVQNSPNNEHTMSESIPFPNDLSESLTVSPIFPEISIKSTNQNNQESPRLYKKSSRLVDMRPASVLTKYQSNHQSDNQSNHQSDNQSDNLVIGRTEPIAQKRQQPKSRPKSRPQSRNFSTSQPIFELPSISSISLFSDSQSSSNMKKGSTTESNNVCQESLNQNQLNEKENPLWVQTKLRIPSFSQSNSQSKLNSFDLKRPHTARIYRNLSNSSFEPPQSARTPPSTPIDWQATTLLDDMVFRVGQLNTTSEQRRGEEKKRERVKVKETDGLKAQPNLQNKTQSKPQSNDVSFIPPPPTDKPPETLSVRRPRVIINKG
ncbi:hypothetical protein P9112_003179 [Eukaryota sp. TZLM1-RC]